jgi:fatty acid CoA ligase FadD9
LDVYRYPAEAVDGSKVPSTKFQTAVRESGREIPHVSADLIKKYIADLQQHGLLS